MTGPEPSIQFTPDHPWPEPLDIKADLQSAPKFDAEALLPEALRDFVLDEADRMPCSPDYIAAALMVSLGAVIGARVGLKPKRHDNWIEVPNLFGGVVGEPSAKKSPAVAKATRYLDRLEAAEAERQLARMKVHQAEMAAFEARKTALKEAMRKAASGKGDGQRMDAAVADMQDLQPPSEPRARRFKSNDATTQKLGDLLVANPVGMLVLRDELVGLLSSWEQEGREGDRAFFLESWGGMGSFNINRIGRGSLFILTLCLSVFGGIQPDLMGKYLASVINSADNDGRVQRFQMMVYPEAVGWEWRDRHPVKGAQEKLRDIFDHLATFDPIDDGAAPANDFVKLPHFAFGDEAQEAFIAWSTELHRVRIANETNPLMRQHLAKFEKLFCAVALILHLAEGRVGAVQVDSALRAAAWCQYLEGHARRIYSLVETARVHTAAMVGRRLAEGKLTDGFTARDVVRKGWAGVGSTMQAESALAALEERFWVQSVDSEEGPGRPTTRYYINPRVRRN